MNSKLHESLSETRLFDPKMIGGSMVEIAMDIMPGQTTDVMTRWYKSFYDSDMVLWSDSEKRIVKYQLNLHGQMIEWNPIDGTRTGLIIETEVVGQGSHPVTTSSGQPAIGEMIRFDESPQDLAIGYAVVVLQNCPALSESERSMLIVSLRESVKLRSPAKERAIQAWEQIAQQISSTERPTFWGRIKDWFYTK